MTHNATAMPGPLLVAEKARAHLDSVMYGCAPAEHFGYAFKGIPSPADVVVTTCEVCDAHGTGAVLRRIFLDGSSILSLRTHSLFGGPPGFRAAEMCFPFALASPAHIVPKLRRSFND